MAQFAQASAMFPVQPVPYMHVAPPPRVHALVDQIADVEVQCASHGRHPAEWDGVNTGWISPQEPAVPYAVVKTSLDPPKRCREVICELLAAGVPVSRGAHQCINNAVDQKRVTKAARKLVADLRTPPGLTPHVTAAVALGILHPQHKHFYLAVQDRIAREEQAAAAYEAVVRHPAGSRRTCTPPPPTSCMHTQLHRRRRCRAAAESWQPHLIAGTRWVHRLVADPWCHSCKPQPWQASVRTRACAVAPPPLINPSKSHTGPQVPSECARMREHLWRTNTSHTACRAAPPGARRSATTAFLSHPMHVRPHASARQSRRCHAYRLP